ncbi:MAG: calcium/sodium antiporter [Rickettsiales bacterium]
MLFGFLEIFGGLALLVLGGEGLVRGAVTIARHLGVPLMIIGLTIVSCGTALPELMISARASSMGYSEMALGNIIGSNITNIFLVVGLTAILCPIAVTHKIIRQDAPLLLGVAAAFIAFCLDDELSRIEALILLGISIAYTIYTILKAKADNDAVLLKEIEEETNLQIPVWRAGFYLLAGLALLVGGSEILIKGGIDLAGNLGVSQAVIALTVFAFGSSLPELVTGIIAARHKHSDIALGNIIGSNLFNLTIVAGVSGSIYTIPVSEPFMKIDLFVLGGAVALLWGFMMLSRTIYRWQGALFLAAYVAYIAFRYYNGGILE